MYRYIHIAIDRYIICLYLYLHLYLCIERKRLIDRLWKISSHHFRGWEVAESTFCKLETHESWWHSLIWVWRLEHQEHLHSGSQSEGRRKGCSNSPTPQSGRRGNSFFILSVVSNGWDDAHPHGGPGGPSALLSSAISMLRSSRNTQISPTPRNNNV